MKAARALTIEAQILGEALRDHHFEALLEKISDGPGVIVEIAARKALVRAIEEGEQPLGAHRLCDLLPLISRGVDAGGVVGAGVQDDDAVFGGGVEGGDHVGEGEALGGFVEVRVRGDAEAAGGEDLVVVRPGGGGEVDGDVFVRKEAGQETGAEVQGALGGVSSREEDGVGWRELTVPEIVWSEAA